MSQLIRLFSIEDHWVVIKGLTSFRPDREGITLACGAENMEEALTADPDSFDLILLDLIIPGTDPENNMELISKTYPGKPVIILTSQESSVWELKMYKAGVKAFLTKTIGRKELVNTIRNVFNGADFSVERIRELESEMKDSTSAWENYLKPKEKEMLKMYLQEKNFKSIADKIGVSEDVVYKTMSRLRDRFKVKNNLALLKIFQDKL
ncbi:MAG: DNA-binding response regulator [Syntrophothermus sp.]